MEVKMEELDEKELKGYLKPLFIEGIEKILYQMKNNICKLCLDDGNKVTGFFCKIPLENKNFFLPVFITNNHIIDSKFIGKEKYLYLKFNNDKIMKKIDLKDRFIYTNEKYDATIIEINEEKDNIHDFLEFDDNILNDPGIGYIGNSVYILHYPSYPNGQFAALSIGIIKNKFEEKNYNFSYLCCTEFGSSGSPILSLSNNKIIGLHKQRSKNNNYNVGVFFHEIIIDFIQKYNIKFKKNKINNINNNQNQEYNLNSKERLDSKKNQNKEIQDIKNIKKKDENDESTIRYRYDGLPPKLFGFGFALRNKDKCKIIFKDKEERLCCFLTEIWDEFNKLEIGNIIEIKLKGIKNIVNMEEMFNGCTQLISLPDIDKIDINNKNIKNIFCGCISLSFLPNISKWFNTNLSYYEIFGNYGFFCCSSLSDLIGLNKDQIDNIYFNVYNPFYGCRKLQKTLNKKKYKIS